MCFKINWANRIVGSKFTVFALLYFVFDGNFPSTSPRGAYIWRGDLTEGFLRYRFGGLIFGGAYTWRGLFSEFYGRLFQSSPGPLFQNEGRCSAFDLEIIFYSHANKTHFHKKGCAPSLILKVRVFGVRKWPILGSKKNGVGRVFLLRHLAQHSRARRHF